MVLDRGSVVGPPPIEARGRSTSPRHCNLHCHPILKRIRFAAFRIAALCILHSLRWNSRRAHHDVAAARLVPSLQFVSRGLRSASILRAASCDSGVGRAWEFVCNWRPRRLNHTPAPVRTIESIQGHHHCSIFSLFVRLSKNLLHL
jgi:hypothetical protein